MPGQKLKKFQGIDVVLLTSAVAVVKPTFNAIAAGIAV